jgi:hypothetical protein
MDWATFWAMFSLTHHVTLETPGSVHAHLPKTVPLANKFWTIAAESVLPHDSFECAKRNSVQQPSRQSQGSHDEGSTRPVARVQATASSRIRGGSQHFSTVTAAAAGHCPGTKPAHRTAETDRTRTSTWRHFIILASENV